MRLEAIHVDGECISHVVRVPMGAPYRVDTRAHRSRNTCCLLEYSRSCADNTDAGTMYARMTMIDADHDVEPRTST